MTTNSPEASIPDETIATPSIAALLAKDPEEITEAEAMTVVGFLRERREQWEAAEGTVKQSGRKGARTPKSAGTGEKSKDISLEDLDLDLDI